MKILLGLFALIVVVVMSIGLNAFGLRSFFVGNITTASKTSETIVNEADEGDSCLPPNKEELAEHLRQNKKFARLVKERLQVEHGFVFKFSTADIDINELKKFIEFEQECCKYMVFSVDSESNKNEIQVRVVGKKTEHPEFFKVFLVQ